MNAKSITVVRIVGSLWAAQLPATLAPKNGRAKKCGMVQKRGLAPSPVAIRPQEMDAGEVPVPISANCKRPRRPCVGGTMIDQLKRAYPPRTSQFPPTVGGNCEGGCKAEF